MDIPVVLSTAFGIVAALYLLLGLYVLYLNPGSKINMLFFAMTITLGIWSFAFGMATDAPDINTALFWRRFAAIGFGAFFSVMLHFVLCMTGNELRGLRRRFWPVIYLPVAGVYLGYTYFPAINPDQYNLIHTEFGWINQIFSNPWEIYFSAYLISYSLAGLLFIWRWGVKSPNPRSKKQSRLLLLSFLLTLVVSSLTDDLLKHLFITAITPQIAPILIVVPALIIYIMIKRYSFLNPRHRDEDSNMIYSQIQEKSINYLSNGFLFAALINLISSLFLMDKPSDGTFLFSGMLMLTGVLFQAIQRYVQDRNLRAYINAVIFAALVPAMTCQFQVQPEVRV